MTLPDRLHFLFGNFLLLSIVHVEPDCLCVCHWDFKFILHFIVYSAVLETVCLQLCEGRVFSGLFRFLGHFFTHTRKSCSEFFYGNFSILIHIKIGHEHGDFFFKWGESISLIQKVFNFIRSNCSTAVSVHLHESCFKLLIGENA